MTTFGKLKVIASHDIGALGPREGEPVTYNWSFLISLFRMLPWLTLIILLLLRPNREWKAWLVIIPLIVVYLGLFLLERVLALIPSEASPVIAWLGLGLTLLLLLSFKLKSLPRMVSFLLAVAIMMGAWVLGILSYTSLSLSSDVLIYLLIYGLGSIILLSGLGAARFFNRKQNTFKWFIVRHPVWHLSVSMVCGLMAYAILILFGAPHGWAGGMVIEGLILGVVAGLVLYCVSFPFLLFAFHSSVYRARLDSVFGFESVRSSSASPERP